MVSVVDAARSSVPPGSNELRLGIRQIEGFINGAVGIDKRTLGWGMTFMHELRHTQVGGGLRDNYSASYVGDAVDKTNQIRAELNAQGGNFGKRFSYSTTVISGYEYLPFTEDANRSLLRGIVPTSGYIHTPYKGKR